MFNGLYELNSKLQQNRLQYDNIKDWTMDCDSCRQLEHIGQKSLRQTANDWIDDVEHTDPVTLDIHLDNICNSACITCDENFSSLWITEKEKLFKSKNLYNFDVYNVDEKINKILNSLNLKELRYIKFFGGEPLFSDTHLKILKKLPCPENVTVHYTTNGSIYPNEETLETWKKFHTIIFAVSLDGVEDQFNYIRWPLPWHKVQNNLIRLRQAQIHNVLFRVEFTVNFLNAWYFDRLETWVNENFVSNMFGDKTELNIHLYYGNNFNLEYMPEDLKNLILEKYSTDHRIHQLVKSIVPQDDRFLFWNYVNLWDNHRKLPWQNAFPDIQSLIPPGIVS